MWRIFGSRGGRDTGGGDGGLGGGVGGGGYILHLIYYGARWARGYTPSFDILKDFPMGCFFGKAFFDWGSFCMCLQRCSRRVGSCGWLRDYITGGGSRGREGRIQLTLAVCPMQNVCACAVRRLGRASMLVFFSLFFFSISSLSIL